MIEIRRATDDDWVDIMMLYQGANDEIDATFGRGANMALIADGVKYALQNDDAVFLAEDDGKVVGVVAWTHTPLCKPAQCVGFGTFVRPRYRRQGVSKMLREAASAWCVSKGYASVEGIAAVTNVAGLRSVLADGFTIVGYLVEKKL